MRKKYLLLCILCLCGAFSVQAQFAPQLFNRQWEFHKGDIPANAAADAATGWEKIDLPHDWSIREPFSDEWASATGYLPGGVGWYKKTFPTQPQWKGKKVFVYFDGVYKNSEVYLNGHLLGKRPNGFIAFQYDLSPYLKASGNNLLTVKADHADFADSRWYTGSGIYRNVYLIVKNPVHIGLWDIAFTTPKVSSQRAEIKVETKITNTPNKRSAWLLQINVIDQQGKLAASSRQKVSVSGESEQVVSHLSVANPLLWDTDRPNLYTLQVRLMQGTTLVDEVTQPVGIRSIRFDKNDGFFLNGKNIKQKGVCIHDDAGALGVAVPQQVWVRRLQLLKDAGVNALRMSHNPHADYLYDLCDRMGFLVMDEAFDEWEYGKNKWVKGWNAGTPAKNGYHEYFKEWAERDLADMVQRTRNHPSIILWSIGNEIDYPNDPYTHEVLNTGRNPQIYGKGYQPDHPPASGLTPIARKLARVVKQQDTTRPVTAALAGVVMSNEVGYPEELDVVGYNYQEYRYPEDHAKYPNRIIYGSENGMRKSFWDAVDSNCYISGQYLWTGIDYLGEAGKWPQRSNGAGLLDLAGFKKPEYFYRQSLWASKPMVYLVASLPAKTEDKGIWSQRGAIPSWNWEAGNDVIVQCYTNCEEVELFLNNRSLGKKKQNAEPMQIPGWRVPYQAGKLLVKGFRGSREVCRFELNTAGEPAQILAYADRTLFRKGQTGLCQLELYIADAKGNPVRSAENQIQVDVSGEAKLIGLESGSTTSHESYQSNQRQALRGRLLAYIQLTGNSGPSVVRITSPGLKPQIIKLKTQ